MFVTTRRDVRAGLAVAVRQSLRRHLARRPRERRRRPRRPWRLEDPQRRRQTLGVPGVVEVDASDLARVDRAHLGRGRGRALDPPSSGRLDHHRPEPVHVRRRAAGRRREDREVVLRAGARLVAGRVRVGGGDPDPVDLRLGAARRAGEPGRERPPPQVPVAPVRWASATPDRPTLAGRDPPVGPPSDVSDALSRLNRPYIGLLLVAGRTRLPGDPGVVRGRPSRCSSCRRRRRTCSSAVRCRCTSDRRRPGRPRRPSRRSPGSKIHTFPFVAPAGHLHRVVVVGRAARSRRASGAARSQRRCCTRRSRRRRRRRPRPGSSRPPRRPGPRGPRCWGP